MATDELTFQQKALTQQGFDYSAEELRSLEWGLRFTPLLCMAIAIYGLYTKQPNIHFGLAALGILPFWFPSGHPLDLLYNHLIRPVFGAVKLPPNPLPRRIACVMGGSMNLFIGLAFAFQNPVLAFVLGGTLVTLQVTVITTHYCVGSLLYELALKMLGRAAKLVPIDQAREMVNTGAQLVDVREPDEFASGHLEGAENIPLDQVALHLEKFRAHPSLLYCQSGMRCQKAIQILRRYGIEDIHNLGPMSRW